MNNQAEAVLEAGQSSQQKTVQILRKKIRIAIKDGDNVIGEIAFNPDDTRTYKRFIEIIESLTDGKRKIDKIEFSESELEKKLETVEDFENAADIFDKMKDATNIAADTWNETCRGLNEIFGNGVCEIFTQGDIDPGLLQPMIDSVMPYFKKAREAKAKPYLKS